MMVKQGSFIKEEKPYVLNIFRIFFEGRILCIDASTSDKFFLKAKFGQFKRGGLKLFKGNL